MLKSVRRYYIYRDVMQKTKDKNIREHKNMCVRANEPKSKENRIFVNKRV